MPNIGEAFTRPYQNEELIEENSDYGKIVCHCERVTLGELNDAMNSEIPATTSGCVAQKNACHAGEMSGVQLPGGATYVIARSEARSNLQLRESLLRRNESAPSQ